MTFMRFRETIRGLKNSVRQRERVADDARGDAMNENKFWHKSCSHCRRVDNDGNRLTDWKRWNVYYQWICCWGVVETIRISSTRICTRTTWIFLNFSSMEVWRVSISIQFSLIPQWFRQIQDILGASRLLARNNLICSHISSNSIDSFHFTTFASKNFDPFNRI